MTEHLSATINDATQYATIYLHRDGEQERPIATLQRRRVYGRGPAWTAFTLDGQLVRTWMLNHPGDYLLRTLAYTLFGSAADAIVTELAE